MSIETVIDKLIQEDLLKFLDDNDVQFDESSLTRIWRQIQEHDSGAITAFRDPDVQTRAESREKNRKLKAALLLKNYSVTKVIGSYIEKFQSENEKEVKEESFFVVDLNDTGKLENDLVKLGKKLSQDSILFVKKGGNNAIAIGTSNREGAWPGMGKKSPVGKGKFGQASGAFFSKIRGRTFTFEESRQPTCNSGRLGLYLVGKELWQDE